MRVLKQMLGQNFKSYGRCAKRARPFLLLFKLCGMFANKITNGQLKRCPKPFYGIGVFWVGVYVSYACFSLNNFLHFAHTDIRKTVDLVKDLIGYISLSVNVIVAYSSQNQFSKVRGETAVHYLSLHFHPLYTLF